MEAMLFSANSFFVPVNGRFRSRPQVVVRSLSVGDPQVSLAESIRVARNKRDQDVSGKLEALWDDGYGTRNADDFLKLAKDFIKPDGGPPRWFCPVSCGRPLENSPLLLYFPGLDGLGLGLILHEKALGKVFEVRCLHIPVQDRSPFEDLLQFVEDTVRFEHASSPKKPIYLVGDSFGGCLALAVAARNPTIDLVIILVNPGLNDILPKDALIWRLKLLQSAAAYANSCLHDITAEVLVLASYKDKLLPSKDEAQRLAKLLQNCVIYIVKGNHHNLLLESDNNLLTILKGSAKYRRTSCHDNIKDYIPPSMSEYKTESEGHWLCHLATSPVMLSTLEDGKIVNGLGGIPGEGPVLFVGNHILMGLDLFIIFLHFLKEKRIMLRGLCHQQNLKLDVPSGMPHMSIWLRVFGMLSVSATNLFKLFSAKSYVLLYPGGAREALHRKGEVYKLFWPEQQEFVRMAAKFGATIIPFGSVGEDDVSEMMADYDDIMKIPGVNKHTQELNQKSVLLRHDEEGEVANQQLHLPMVMPKLPGRLYYLFGKPIKTKGIEKILNDKEISQAMYLKIKCEVEKNIAYLIKKREEDPYRGFFKRVMYQVKTSTPWDQVPTFMP